MLKCIHIDYNAFMNIGDQPTNKKIRVLRTLAGFSQQDLAERVGVNPTTIHRWETEKGYEHISISHMKRLAEALGVSPADLMGAA